MASAMLDKGTTALLNRLSVLEALADVQPAIPKQSPKPILMKVRLTLGPDGSEIEATNLEIGIVRSVLGVRCDTPVQVVLPPERLASILRGTDDEDVTLAAGPDVATIRGRRWHFELPTEDPSLFPGVPRFAAADYHVVAPADLRKLIRRTVYATDPESTRYALGGALLEVTPDSLAMIATDGRRLARQAVPAEAVGKGIAWPTAVVPARAMKLIDRVLGDDGAGVLLAADESAAVVRVEDATIYARLVEGRFPRYQDVFPPEAPAVVTVGAGALLDAAGQATIATSAESRGVDFAFDGPTLKVSAQAVDVGAGEAEVDISTLSGGPVNLSLDPRYLTEALRALDRGATLRIEMIDAKTAMVVRADDGFALVIMPLTRDR
jgi:DNA polymerase-3 subunit beta